MAIKIDEDTFEIIVTPAKKKIIKIYELEKEIKELEEIIAEDIPLDGELLQRAKENHPNILWKEILFPEVVEKKLLLDELIKL